MQGQDIDWGKNRAEDNHCRTSACCGLARLAETVGNDYFLEGERLLAANPPAVIYSLENQAFTAGIW